MDMDRAWDAWLGTPHADHGGFLVRGDTIRCACRALIPLATETMPDPAPGYEWHREMHDD